MNQFRILFQIFLVFVFFSGIYVIVWLDKYHESFIEAADGDEEEEKEFIEEVGEAAEATINAVGEVGEVILDVADEAGEGAVEVGLIAASVLGGAADLIGDAANALSGGDANASEENPSEANSASEEQPAPDTKGNEMLNYTSTDSDYSKFLPSNMAYPGSQYAPFDPLNEDIDHYEYVAKEYVSSQPDGLSDNPMDPNWGGVMYTQNVIKSGKYEENNVNKPLLFQPRGIYIDNIPSSFGKPQDIL
jgi:hypothetical protein